MQNSKNSSIYALELGPMENFVYLLHDHATDTAAIVDPAWDVKKVLELAKSKNIEITDILLTHSHNDHTNGIADVLEEFDAEIHLLKAESQFWGAQLEKPTLHYGGDTVSVGESSIEILHTPGHTPGSACYKLGENLVAGDTLFVFGCGRCDLHGGDPEEMHTTLSRIATELPADTVIHPGHNYAPKNPTSTLAEQISGNPFLHFDHKDDFVKYRMQVHDRVRETPYSAMTKHESNASLK